MSAFDPTAMYFSASPHDRTMVDDSTVPCLSLDDLIKIPEDDEDETVCVSDAPSAPRAKAMSLEFILSDWLSRTPATASPDTLYNPMFDTSDNLCSPLGSKDRRGYFADGEPIVKGWVSPDDQPYADLGAPIPRSTISPSATFLNTATFQPVDVLRLPTFPHVPIQHTPPLYNAQFEETKPCLNYPGFAAPAENSAQQQASIPERRPFAERSVNLPLNRTLPSQVTHPVVVPAGLFQLFERMPRTIAAGQATTGPRPEDPSRGAPASTRRTGPPPPQGGVSPAVARSITTIRLARERAQQQTARAQAADRHRGTSARVPSVLARHARARDHVGDGTVAATGSVSEEPCELPVF